MCLCGDFCHSLLCVFSGVTWISVIAYAVVGVSMLMFCCFGVGIWLCFMFVGWYSELLRLRWAMAVGVVSVVVVCLRFASCLRFFFFCRGGGWSEGC